MTEIAETTVHPPESGSHMEPGEAQVRKAGKEAEERYHDFKEKAAETMGRLSESFSETAESAREGGKRIAQKTREAGTVVYDAISENLFPTILIGVGAAWLTAGIIRGRSDEGYEPGAPGEPACMTEKTGSRIGPKAKEMSQRARDGSRRAREKSKEIVTRNPFYVAGALVAVGALIGLAFPETRREKKLYNEMREEIIEGERQEGPGSTGD